MSRTVKPKSRTVAFFIQNDRAASPLLHAFRDSSKRGMQGVFTIS